LAAGGDRRRHQRLLHFGRAAMRTGHQLALLLFVEIVIVAEPGFEFVILFAGKGEAHHDAALSGSAARAASTTSSENSREFLRLGSFLRASSDAAVSMSATITPGSS